ncbi:MAG: hypothetical protein M1838_001585 [Thelocarpon superellum]|nr:MAG: hypothetical protein M1838_001585 [Thelocarpon superellum]
MASPMDSNSGVPAPALTPAERLPSAEPPSTVEQIPTVEQTPTGPAGEQTPSVEHPPTTESPPTTEQSQPTKPRLVITDSAPVTANGAGAEQSAAIPAPPDSNAPGNPAPASTGVEASTGEPSKESIPSSHAKLEQREAQPAPPAYGTDDPSRLDIQQEGFTTEANIAHDGRVNININQSSRRLTNLLAPLLRGQIHKDHEHPTSPPPGYIPPALAGEPGQPPPPPLNVVIQVVGSRGDVQPFVALGKTLKEKYNHRVRLATHPNFKGFVEENGLEFFSISGDPAELMAFMVKNPGLMPGFESLRSGDVGNRRRGIYEILKGCWRSCIEAGDGMGVAPTDDYAEDYGSVDSGVSMGGGHVRPFVADAIIANPPSFAHIHCAEKLGIPLHLMFTMPWSPTQAFPHPLANIQSSNADSSLTNFVSYALVEMLTWQGLGDVINRFRESSLKLEPVSQVWAPGMASRLRIPYTYCWSPALIPKPKDWGPHISISGFYFLSLASSYTPDPDLVAFLEAGPPPVYIGFGSIVVDDPDAMTRLIFGAIKKAGVRALVSQGWGGLGAGEVGLPDGVFMLGNIPHDWLFKRVSCVVHHGGAGTTAAGIALGKPTVVVPFFGDQPFWGAMVARAGAGPVPVAYKHLTADVLAASILAALKPAAQEQAAKLGASIAQESGAEEGARSFHKHLDIDHLRCSLAPSRIAVWRVRRTQVRLSALAATVLVNEGLLEFTDLKLYRPREYESEDGPWDPISGGATALLGTIGSLMMGVADFPVEILRAVKNKVDEGHGKSKTSTPTPSRHASGNLTPVASSVTASTPATEVSASTPEVADVAILSHDTALVRSSETSTLASEISDPSTSAATPQTSVPGSPIADEAQEHRHSIDAASLDRDTATPSSPAAHRPRSMAQVFSSHLGRSHSERSRSERSHSPSHHRTRSGSPGVSLESVIGAGKGVGRLVGVGLRSPMDFTLALARGFHNAPKLYGDSTVRAPDKVTGIQSGLKAAGKEFGFGFFDGISGLVMQPIHGAKDEGAAGFLKGLYKGLGGVVLKPGAAIWALPGYTFMGIYKELQKAWGSSVQNYIVAARTAQGFEDWKDASPEEREDVEQRWHALQAELEQPIVHPVDHHCTFPLKPEPRRKHMTLGEKIRQRNKGKDTKATHQASEPSSISSDATLIQRSSSPLQHANTFPRASLTGVDHEHFEEAIQQSVASTSCGNAAEDALIERAIRASVTELVVAQREQLSDAHCMDRAVNASMLVASRMTAEGHPAYQKLAVTSEEHRAALHSSLYHSLQQQGHVQPHPRRHSGTDLDWDDSAVETEDDETLKRVLETSKAETSKAGASHEAELHKAIEASKASHPQPQVEAELAKAIEDSKASHRQQQAEAEKSKTEEEIVLAYVQRQSLAEAEHKRALDQQGMGMVQDADEHDAELKKAIAHSLEERGEASSTAEARASS